jgi:hypothetical protein
VIKIFFSYRQGNSLRHSVHQSNLPSPDDALHRLTLDLQKAGCKLARVHAIVTDERDYTRRP